MTRLSAQLAALALLLSAGAALAAEPVAVLTEIRVERGGVEVRRAGEPTWKAPQPLLALRAGDQIRATGEARAVVLFTGGRGAQSVSVSNSPFTVQAPAGAGPGERVRGLLGGITDFLLGKEKDLAYLPLSVREVRPPRLAILSPRDTRLLPGPVTLEWSGSDSFTYRVRVLGPQGTLWEQADLRRRPLVYPGDAPALSPGVRYTWQLEAPGQPVQQAFFEILPVSEASPVREALDLLMPAGLPGYTRSSVTLLRAALLFERGLYADSRRELLAAIAADPDEPTLHFLLGQLYERVGLRELATRELIEARDLSRARP